MNKRLRSWHFSATSGADWQGSGAKGGERPSLDRETFEGFGVQVGITPQALVTKRAGQRVMGRNALSGWVAVQFLKCQSLHLSEGRL